MPLPANYKFSTWVLQSNLDKERKRKTYAIDVNTRWDANEHLKVPRRQNVASGTQYATEAAIGNYVEQAKNAVKTFNYSRADKLKVFSSIILDLHDESNTLEKLDKQFDIRDGFTV